MTLLTAWQFWAALSACFAALTALFAKIGVAGINADLATFLRTVVILVALVAFLTGTDQWQPIGGLSRRAMAALVLSGLATGASWVCYFRALRLGPVAQVAPVDKLSVVLVAVMGTLFLGERLSAINWLGVALIGAGVVLTVLKV